MASFIKRNQDSTLEAMLGEAIINLISRYINNPEHSKWSEMIKIMDMQGGASREIAFVRYVIELSRDKVLTMAQSNHWMNLVMELGEEELMVVITSLPKITERETHETKQLKEKIQDVLDQALKRYF